MSAEESSAVVPGECAPPAVPGGGDPAGRLRLARGFSCLFWSLPLLAAAHALALTGRGPARWTVGALLVGFLPLACGLWLLRTTGDWTPKWRRWVGRVVWAALLATGLCPFLAWWTAVPTRIYFGANAAAHYVAMIALLVGLNRLVGECARGLDDLSLRRESQAGVVMVLWLSGGTVGALAWMFHRAGVLAAGIPAVLAQLADLPSEARTLFLLPYAMTAYVLWRAKETGFRNAVRSAP